jgi:hypothetical protein
MTEAHAPATTTQRGDAAPPRAAAQALLAVQASLDRRDNGGDGAAELAR